MVKYYQNPADFLGFDKFFNIVEDFSNNKFPKNDGYPPYNIIKENDNKYRIEIAIAGFGENDLTIEHNNSKLTVKGSINKDDSVEKNYIHKGIAERAFVRTFHLAETVVVNNASLVNGVLVIELENIIPDNKKPKLIPIGKPKSEAKLLVE